MRRSSLEDALRLTGTTAAFSRKGFGRPAIASWLRISRFEGHGFQPPDKQLPGSENVVRQCSRRIVRNRKVYVPKSRLMIERISPAYDCESTRRDRHVRRALTHQKPTSTCHSIRVLTPALPVRLADDCSRCEDYRPRNRTATKP